MAQFTGMDIPAVRSLAKQMDSDAVAIEQIKGRLTSSLDSTQWVGRDQQAFVQDWSGQYSQALQQVIQGLREASERARRNADEQEQASA